MGPLLPIKSRESDFQYPSMKVSMSPLFQEVSCMAITRRMASSSEGDKDCAKVLTERNKLIPNRQHKFLMSKTDRLNVSERFNRIDLGSLMSWIITGDNTYKETGYQADEQPHPRYDEVTLKQVFTYNISSQ